MRAYLRLYPCPLKICEGANLSVLTELEPLNKQGENGREGCKLTGWMMRSCHNTGQESPSPKAEKLLAKIFHGILVQSLSGHKANIQTTSGYPAPPGGEAMCLKLFQRLSSSAWFPVGRRVASTAQRDSTCKFISGGINEAQGLRSGNQAWLRTYSTNHPG